MAARSQCAQRKGGRSVLARARVMFVTMGYQHATSATLSMKGYLSRDM